MLPKKTRAIGKPNLSKSGKRFHVTIDDLNPPFVPNEIYKLGDLYLSRSREYEYSSFLGWLYDMYDISTAKSTAPLRNEMMQRIVSAGEQNAQYNWMRNPQNIQDLYQMELDDEDQQQQQEEPQIQQIQQPSQLQEPRDFIPPPRQQEIGQYMNVTNEERKGGDSSAFDDIQSFDQANDVPIVGDAQPDLQQMSSNLDPEGVETRIRSRIAAFVAKTGERQTDRLIRAFPSVIVKMKKNVYDLDLRGDEFVRSNAQPPPQIAPSLEAGQSLYSFKLVKKNIIQRLLRESIRFQKSEEWMQQNGFEVIKRKVSVTMHLKSGAQALFIRDVSFDDVDQSMVEALRSNPQYLRELGLMDYVQYANTRTVTAAEVGQYLQHLKPSTAEQADLIQGWSRLANKTVNSQTALTEQQIQNIVFGLGSVPIQDALTARNLMPEFGQYFQVYLRPGQTLQQVMANQMSVSIKNICVKRRIQPLSFFIKQYFMPPQLLGQPDMINQQFQYDTEGNHVIAKLRQTLLIAYKKRKFAETFDLYSTIFGGDVQQMADIGAKTFELLRAYANHALNDVFMTIAPDMRTSVQRIKYFKLRKSCVKLLGKIMKLINWILGSLSSDTPKVVEVAIKLAESMGMYNLQKVGEDTSIGGASKQATENLKICMKRLGQDILNNIPLFKLGRQSVLALYNTPSKYRMNQHRGVKGFLDQQFVILMNFWRDHTNTEAVRADLARLGPDVINLSSEKQAEYGVGSYTIVTPPRVVQRNQYQYAAKLGALTQ